MHKVETGTTTMEDIKNTYNLNGNQMELMLELDEEDASLLEEMERQEASQIARPKSQEGLLQLEGVEVEEQENFEITQFPESGIETGAVSSIENHELVDEHLENTSGLVSTEASLVDEHSEEAKAVKPDQENLLERHSESSQNSRVVSRIEKTPNSNEEAQQDPLTYCFPDGIQILKLDMSESELHLAKSAAAQKSQSGQSRVNATSSGNAYQFLNSVSSKDDEERYLRCILNTQTEDFLKTTSGIKRKTKSKTYKFGKKRKIQTTKKQRAQTLDEHKKRSPNNKDCSPSQTKRMMLNIMGPQEPRVVNFQCNYCDFQCPFKKENVDEIVEHITPRERFNHLHEIPKRFENFKETIRLSIMIAKNKAKAQVRFLSHIECSTCHQQLPLSVDSCDQLLVHYNWCKKVRMREKFFTCLYCNSTVHRGSIKKHLGMKSKKQCTMNVAVTLQLMSCVCKRYAESHQPVCIVCNEKRWPYPGHRSELDPVCETCRFNITSGNTTKLRVRDLAGCAVCGCPCSEKFVTYWASELESLFIGEKCISKLESPASKKSVKLAAMKKAKVKKFVESAITSVHMHERAQSNVIPSDSVMSSSESNMKRESWSFASSSASKSVQNENPLPNIAMSLNGSSSSHQSHCFISSSRSKSLQSGKILMKQTAAQDHSSILNKSKTEASMIKQITLGHCDLPIYPRASSGGFIPVTGSFKINNSMKLPFTSLASIADNLGADETVAPKSSTEINKVKSIVQGGVPYTLLLPNDAPKVVFRRCMPKITSDSVENPKTIFRAIKPRPDIPPTSVNDDASDVDAVQSTETPVIISFRSKSEKSVPSDVSLSHSCKVTSRPSSLFQVGMEPQQQKYVIKYVSTLTESDQERNSDQHDKKNSSCIIIKTSCSTTKTEEPTLSPLWVAQVYKTNESVCNEGCEGNGKLERKRKRKPLVKTKGEEVIDLD